MTSSPSLITGSSLPPAGEASANWGFKCHKWIRWPTYDRKLEEIFAAEAVVDAHLLGFVQKLERRSRR
jgi:hypothetical protein